MSLFKFKNKINSHVVFNNTVKQIVEEIQKIPKYNELKGNPEIVLITTNWLLPCLYSFHTRHSTQNGR